MRSFRHSFFVDAEISRVWEFYTDIRHLEVITPPELELRVIKSTNQVLTEGSEVWITGRLVTRSNWHSKITSLKPYEYIDEMITGRFRVWKHAHKFRAAGDRRTEVIDEIDFELHYGPIGKIFEGYVMKRLARTFAHRMMATKAEFERTR
jgi:ligand-binding SRPBCC domain-containing protein